MRWLLAFLRIFPSSESGSDTEQNRYAIAEYTDTDGFVVIYSIDLFGPTQAELETYPWLTIVSWPYDGSDSNGMPSQKDKAPMRLLQNVLSTEFEGSDHARWVYNRTGSNLKEFAFYVRDRDEFISNLNSSLRYHQEYPIEIEFFEDPHWKDLSMVRKGLGIAN